jgi:hypothetical protein
MTNFILRARPMCIATAAVLALSAMQCRRVPQPAPQASPASSLAGTWLHRAPMERYTEAMELRVIADSVLGEGTYSNLAGRAGTTTIIGKWGGTGGVALDILRDTGVRERWAGTLRGDTLAGTLVVADSAARPFNYVRQR